MLAGVDGGVHFRDLRHTGNTWAAEPGATSRELMDRWAMRAPGRPRSNCTPGTTDTRPWPTRCPTWSSGVSPPLVWQAILAVVVALVGAMVLYLLLAWLLDLPRRPSGDQIDQQKLLADLVKIALGLAAGIGAAVALIVAYRRTLSGGVSQPPRRPATLQQPLSRRRRSPRP